jgi:hypothetical protein
MTMTVAKRSLQRGIGTFGSLIVIALAGVAAYYIYLNVTGEGAAPTCKSELEKCMQRCRKTSTDSTAAQACQKSCQRESYLCEGMKQ